MATFIDEDGEPELPPPYYFPGVSITSFRLEGTLEAIQALCDKFLNIGSLETRGFAYVAASHFVDLEILTYPRMECVLPPFNTRGFCSQKEIYFRVFVVKLEVVGNLLIPSEVGWFFPFVFVDNPWSLVSGREVIAFPKGLAAFRLPNAPTPYPIEVCAYVLDRYDPNTRLTERPVVNIRAARRAHSKPPVGPWPWGDMDFSKLSWPLQVFLNDLAIFAEPTLRAVGLKQFRDAQIPTAACYQAIVESEFTATNIAFTPLAPADVVLSQYDSFPIIKSFGFNGPNLVPLWEYDLRCDMSFGNCRNVFVA
jgi:hypothetical protein